jgi:hypothetical protein
MGERDGPHWRRGLGCLPSVWKAEIGLEEGRYEFPGMWRRTDGKKDGYRKGAGMGDGVKLWYIKV